MSLMKLIPLILVLFFVFSATSWGAEEDQKPTLPNKAMKWMRRIFKKPIPQWPLPEDVWPLVAASLNCRDYLRLATVCTDTYTALAKPDSLLSMAQTMHLFRFLIFMNEERPFGMLRAIHYFNRANGAQKPAKDIVLKKLNSRPITLKDMIQCLSDPSHHRHYALSADGKVYVLGFNMFGILGAGEVDKPIDTPIPVKGALKNKQVIAIQTGQLSVMALTADGKVYVWGQVLNLPVPDEQMSFTFITSPFLVEGDLKDKQVIAIRAGNNHCLSLTSDGEICVFGISGCGALGYDPPEINAK